MATWRPMRRWCWPRTPASKPRELAEAIAAKLRADPLVAKVDVAGPGFINLTLKPAAWIEALARGAAGGTRITGAVGVGQGAPVNVEYVSANPTGPMHVGHCRGAVFGDALANLLDFAGFKVTREYYINDAGAQVDVLARSAYLRYREALGEDIGAIPEGLYPGDYLKPVGEALVAECGRALLGKPESDWLPMVRQRAIELMMVADPQRSRRAQRPARRVLLRALAVEREQRRGRQRPSRRCAPRGWSIKAACRRRRARRSRIGRTASRRCSARPTSATTSTGRCSSPTAATPTSPPTSPTTSRSSTAASAP